VKKYHNGKVEYVWVQNTLPATGSGAAGVAGIAGLSTLTAVGIKKRSALKALLKR
jgi:hypothetical protein